MHILLGLYFAVAGTDARTYGPLLSIIALLLWSGLTSLALHLGLAVSAELTHAVAAERSVSVRESPGRGDPPRLRRDLVDRRRHV